MKEIEYAEHHELVARGIRQVVNKGVNAFGLVERTIILHDGSVWEYIPEDNIYQFMYDTQEPDEAGAKCDK